ncbi:MAG: phenylalanine--tRNA ligase subunit beta [Candidatus Cloacimonetes bacterium]|nr:phenylalanine--tRNA ligase subunit beta [Candidatus Cloacimonadota bacterium]
MKISFNWLKEYIDIKLSANELQGRMTFAGIEVEGIEELGSTLKQIKIAEVVEFKKHPNADKLSVCQVNDGSSTRQVICGAPNCRNGIKVAFAGIGTKLQDLSIKKVKLRGIESFGMICSEQELGISEAHEGIMILPEDAPIGTDLASYLSIEDTCYDVEITPNRPDLLGIIGIARDLSALLELPLKIPLSKLKESNESINDQLKLENKVPKLCTRYTARMIKNVEIKASPDWLKKHLISVGLRPINNIVDITNFVMMEFGHPLHAFDHSLIKGKKIIIRKAKDKEIFPALDEENYHLEKDDIVIADTERSIALAGIIGGANSHITTKTSNIVIESANFLYSSIRKTTGRLKISTDSSYRFERDITEEAAELASKRACELILEIAGGQLLQGKLDSYPAKRESKPVTIRRSRTNKILSLDLTSEQIIKYLTSLGLTLLNSSDDEILKFDIPYYRKDLTREIDLIEEVIRLHGYNNIPTISNPKHIMNKYVFYTKRKVEDVLVNYGFSEVVNWNFGDPNDLDKLNIGKEDNRRDFAKLKNPLGESFSIMRSMLLPSLLKNALYNLNHGQKDFRLFELKKVFTRKSEKLANEKLLLSGLMIGQVDPIYWKIKPVQIDFYDVKGIVEDLLDHLNLTAVKFEKSREPYYQPGMGTEILYEGKVVARIGKIDPKIAAAFDIEIPLYSFDIELQEIFELDISRDSYYENIPKFPPVLRDISFVVAKKYNYSSIIEKIKNSGEGIISKIVLFDEFDGGKIMDGYHSLSFNLMFSSETKTLTDEYINNILKKIIKNLKDSYDAVMR